MADDPKKTDADEPEDESDEKDSAKKDSPAAAEKRPSGKDKKSSDEHDGEEDEEEEDEEEEDEEEEEEKPAPKKKAPEKAAAKPAKAAEPPKPKPKKHVGPFIIGPKELPPPPKKRDIEKRPALLLAEYSTPGKCLHAAEKLRDSGYKKFDTHTPFPVHGMDAAMGLPDSRVGWIVLCGGLTGLGCATLMMWWMGGVDYPIIIGGKPGFTLPSSVPIMFELTILLSAFAAVFGMLGLNQLPRHHHPIFESERFLECTDDKFFVSVEADDPKFDLKRTRALLEGTHADHVELVEEEVQQEPEVVEEH